MSKCKEYSKIYNVENFYILIDKTIQDIKKINNKYDFKIIKCKKNDNYYYIKKYYNNILYNKLYNTIDVIYYYIKGIKETLQDEQKR